MGEKDIGHCGVSMKQTKVAAWIRRYGKYVVCIVSGVIFYLLAEVSGQDVSFVENGMLYRNPCGQGDAVYRITVDGLDKDFTVELSVPEQELSEEVFQSSVSEIADILLDRMVGENPSLQEVYTNLELVREIPEYGVQISWKSDCPDVVWEDGTVHANEITDVFLEARLSNGT